MNFVLKGNICHSKSLDTLETIEAGYLVCENGISRGVFTQLPAEFSDFPLTDYGDQLIIPGLIDLHLHAPQYSFRGLGMDMELLDWLETHTFPEEARYADLDYANKAYTHFVQDLTEGATSRASIFATLHTPATLALMAQLERSGLVTMVGKVNMDRNSPDILREANAAEAIQETERWILEAQARFTHTKAILTPRFTPTCSDDLMCGLSDLQQKYQLPVQSHLSESLGEIAWVKELCPNVSSYGEAYQQFGLFGGKNVPTLMAHCIWSRDQEEDLLLENEVFVVHCPQSNMNLSSGIAPIRRFLKRGIHVGLGSDVAGGFASSIFRAMSDAIQVSKLYWRLIDERDAPLTIAEAFYLATRGGGRFFGKVGCFADGYEFDALVLDDSSISSPYEGSITARLERIVYLSDDRHIRDKYVKGRLMYQKP